MKPRSSKTAAEESGEGARAWAPQNAGDHDSYGTEVDIVDDDGYEAISLDKFIYDKFIYDKDTQPVLKFIADAAQALLQELLNKLSAGNIDPDFLAQSENLKTCCSGM